MLNHDETSVYICQNTGKVIAPKGYKNVYKIVKGKEKEATTAVYVGLCGFSVCAPTKGRSQHYVCSVTIRKIGDRVDEGQYILRLYSKGFEQTG